MPYSTHSDRVRTIREAIAHFEDWVLTNDRDPDLAPGAQRFICEYVILNAHDEAVRQMWSDYTRAEGITCASEAEA